MRKRTDPKPLVQQERDDPLLTPGEVAEIFRCDPRTVLRWEQKGRLSAVRTGGGHRRYRSSEVKALLEGKK